MADEGRDARRSASADVLGRVVGLLVFLTGVALLVLVFVWAYQLFDTIDEYVDSAAPALVARSPQPDNPPLPSPVPERTLAQVAAIIGLKVLAVFALGYLASLVAGRGANLIAAHRGADRATGG